jgi:hypothetical protein
MTAFSAISKNAVGFIPLADMKRWHSRPLHHPLSPPRHRPLVTIISGFPHELTRTKSGTGIFDPTFRTSEARVFMNIPGDLGSGLEAVSLPVF